MSAMARLTCTCPTNLPPVSDPDLFPAKYLLIPLLTDESCFASVCATRVDRQHVHPLREPYLVVKIRGVVHQSVEQDARGPDGDEFGRLDHAAGFHDRVANSAQTHPDRIGREGVLGRGFLVLAISISRTPLA